MARSALLTTGQCAKIQAQYKAGARAVDLAKKFGVSESSLYKVLDGTYKARPNDSTKTLPVIAPDKPMGITPSLFAESARSLDVEPHPLVQQMLEKAQGIGDVELDEVTIAAAQLIMAKARLQRALAHVH